MLDTNDLSDPDAELLLNRSYWELLDKFPFREKEVTQTFCTVAATGFYQVPQPFEALQLISIEDINSLAHVPLKRLTQHQYETEFVNKADAQGKPEWYLREKDGVRLLPIPDVVYTITIKYWSVLADLSSTNLQTPLPQVWDEMLLFGGVWRGFMRQGDYERAREAKAHQVALINSTTPIEAKEETDTHFGGVEVPGYDVI